MAKTRHRQLNERLMRVSEELIRTHAALMRHAARNAELRSAMVKLCRELRDEVRNATAHSHRKTCATADLSAGTARTGEATMYGLARGFASPRLRRVIDHIEASLAERLDVATLAAIAGMSPAHFATRFRQATGLPPHEAVIRLRLARSKELLADETQTIAAISCQLGFSSQAHFTTVFRQRFGVTPAGWRVTRLRPLLRYQSRRSPISEDAGTRPKIFESHGGAPDGLMGAVTEPPLFVIGASRPGAA